MKENDEELKEEEAGTGEEIKEVPEEAVERLKAELETKTKEAADNYDRFLRVCADLENYKKRAEREKTDCITYANESLLADVLPIIDNFDRALNHAADETTLDSLKEGVKLTIGQIWGVLKKYGLQEIPAVGEKFNPALHHAISHEETMDCPPDTVLSEFQKGYMLKGRLLRPSMVSVAKRPDLTESSH